MAKYVVTIDEAFMDFGHNVSPQLGTWLLPKNQKYVVTILAERYLEL